MALVTTIDNVRNPQRILMLFVAGDGPNSLLARNNLQKLIEKSKGYTFDVSVIDVLKDFRSAQDQGVLVTPSLVLVAPEPKATIVGTLSDTHKVRVALRLGME